MMLMMMIVSLLLQVMIFSLFEIELVNLVFDESMWIIDSVATLHVTPRKKFFTSYTSSDFGVLKMGNDGVTKVIDVGDVCLQTNTGMQLWLRGVKHAPDVHFNLISVHMLDDAKKDMLPRLKNIELDKCSHYMAGKQTRVSFKKHPPSRNSELLILVHSNVKSFSDGLYFVTFIGDCSRKLWVYTLKSKNQVLKKFKQFQALVGRQSGKKVLYTTMHVINLSPAIALNIEVPDKIWFGKDVKYDHLQVFSCKAFVHVPKDERSKLDMKTRQCIFIGYGHDEYGYRMYDLVEKKLVRSHDVQFMEDQTIEDIDKVKKSTPEKDKSMSDIDPIWMLVHDLDTTDNNVQNGDQHNYVGDQQLGDGFDVPLDDDAEEEQEMSQDENLGDAPEPPPVQLRRSNRYTSNEYVTLTDGEEPKCYQESMESEERQKTWQSKLQKCVVLSTTKAEFDFVQDEHWLFYDSQIADMMTKAVSVDNRSNLFNLSSYKNFTSFNPILKTDSVEEVISRQRGVIIGNFHSTTKFEAVYLVHLSLAPVQNRWKFPTPIPQREALRSAIH
ncbi:hypothetical protein CR513_47218, partial [Mucuna pruriens]